jgi:FKBP-type peptidyl-prolyl cis-trans isomerase 2
LISNNNYLIINKNKIMEKIKNGDTVSVNYTGRLEDGTIFDTSLMEGRTPLKVTLGQNQLIKGFENGLIDMSEGDKKTVEIEPSEAYGDHNPEMIIEIPSTNVPPDVQVGQMLQGNSPQGPVNVKVLEIKEDVVVLDGNHPLAGKKLIFDLEVVGID